MAAATSFSETAAHFRGVAPVEVAGWGPSEKHKWSLNKPWYGLGKGNFAGNKPSGRGALEPDTRDEGRHW